MSSPSLIVDTLLEDGITLDQYLSDNTVEDWIVENKLSGVPMDVPMPVHEVDPATLNTTTGYTLTGQLETAQQEPHKEIVDRYRFMRQVDPILLDADRETILDGNHRAMAALLEERTVPAICIADIP